ncbi:hypothetical protein [Pseudoxanthomonas sp.]|uniref:hypothetical protein n=1 Tax=Pseudoxanthomonas sp. TaxID=1871049 RepID=UPI002614B323|nr:hypothetical protein [Pseudoxanthomonas sp.]WDS36946.1 MAG: hypothetical protein O8I58_03290 [Pseudoxanthomonas sp.]
MNVDSIQRSSPVVRALQQATAPRAQAVRKLDHQEARPCGLGALYRIIKSTFPMRTPRRDIWRVA